MESRVKASTLSRSLFALHRLQANGALLAAHFRSASLIYYELSSVERQKLQSGGNHPKAEGDDLRDGMWRSDMRRKG